MQSLGSSRKPGAEAILGSTRRMFEYGPGCKNEEGAQISVATLRDTSKNCSFSGRHLSRHQAELGGEIPSFGESCSATDGRHHGVSGNGADAGKAHQMLAIGVAVRQRLYLATDRIDALIKPPPIAN